MHKSIFKKVEDYKSNPIEEYIKLASFYDDSTKVAYYHYGTGYSFYSLLAESFVFCEKITGVYKDFKNCLNSQLRYLTRYPNGVAWDYLENDKKEIVLDEFQTFAEIISYIYFYGVPKFISSNIGLNLNETIFYQGLQLLQTSLKSINYEIKVLKKQQIVEIIKINPVAEKVAFQSNPEIKKTIISYLGVHNNDIEGKRHYLHDLIDLLEPKLKKFESQDKIGLIKNYCQIMRHPETKGKQAQYQWFMDSQDKYLDDMFELCIYVLQYDLANTTLKQFTDNTKNCLIKNQ